jgi:hypothetical protein
MSTNQNSSHENGKRYVLYVPTPFKGPQTRDVLNKVTTVAKKLFKGATSMSRKTKRRAGLRSLLKR